MFKESAPPPPLNGYKWRAYLQNDLHSLRLILKKVTFLRIYGHLLSADGSKSISIKSACKSFCKKVLQIQVGFHKMSLKQAFFIDTTMIDIFSPLKEMTSNMVKAVPFDTYKSSRSIWSIVAWYLPFCSLTIVALRLQVTSPGFVHVSEGWIKWGEPYRRQSYCFSDNKRTPKMLHFTKTCTGNSIKQVKVISNEENWISREPCVLGKDICSCFARTKLSYCFKHLFSDETDQWSSVNASRIQMRASAMCEIKRAIQAMHTHARLEHDFHTVAQTSEGSKHEIHRRLCEIQQAYTKCDYSGMCAVQRVPVGTHSHRRRESCSLDDGYGKSK